MDDTQIQMLRPIVHNQDAEVLKGLKLDADMLPYLTHRGWQWMGPALLWESAWVMAGQVFEQRPLYHLDEKGCKVSVAGIRLTSFPDPDATRTMVEDWLTDLKKPDVLPAFDTNLFKCRLDHLIRGVWDYFATKGRPPFWAEHPNTPGSWSHDHADVLLNRFFLDALEHRKYGLRSEGA